MAAREARRVRIEGKTIFGEKAAREVWVCGPGAFVVLKALAFLGRGENKDAYDLYYLVRNFGVGVEDVAASLRPLLGDAEGYRQSSCCGAISSITTALAPVASPTSSWGAPMTRSRPT